MRYWTQILAAIGAGLGFLALGNAVGYATIALPQLSKEQNSSLQFSEDSGSWGLHPSNGSVDFCLHLLVEPFLANWAAEK